MNIIQTFDTPELIITLGIGLAVALFGYRLKKIAFFIIWFLLGYCGTQYLMPTLTQMWPEIMATELYQMLVPLAGGLLLALLGFSIEKLCVGGICFALTILVAMQTFGTEMSTIAIAAVIGVLLAGVAVMLMKPATILVTAGAGGYAMAIAILGLVPELAAEIYYWPLLLGIMAVGAIFQFLTTKRMS